MSPQEIAALAAVARLISDIGIWPPLLLVIGPWVLAVALMWMIEKSQARRFRAVQEMYESNASLAKAQIKLTEDYKELAEGVRDLLLANTQNMALLNERIMKS